MLLDNNLQLFVEQLCSKNIPKRVHKISKGYLHTTEMKY